MHSIMALFARFEDNPDDLGELTGRDVVTLNQPASTLQHA